VDALSCLEIDSLKTQYEEEEEEEELTVLSWSENSSISNIKLKASMHIVLIFKEQAKVKNIWWREKRQAQPHHSMHHIEGDFLYITKITNKIYIPQSMTHMTKSTVLVTWIFTSSGTDKNR
jgi:hypothetical protein